MGVLDDAIREHLELKRQHGAAEEELERQEEEALGPARREVATEPEDEAGEPVPEADTAGDEQVVEQESGVEEEVEVEVAAEEPPAAEAPTEFIDHAATLDAEPAPEAPAVVEPPPPDGPAPVEDEPPAPAPSSRDDEVESWLEEEEPPAEASEAEEAEEAEDENGDVLEDTPDFLQETPEHDRLWFEQKPPRDFDFD